MALMIESTGINQTHDPHLRKGDTNMLIYPSTCFLDSISLLFVSFGLAYFSFLDALADDTPVVLPGATVGLLKWLATVPTKDLRRFLVFQCAVWARFRFAGGIGGAHFRPCSCDRPSE